ncbi:MAG: glycosyltransferase family A protein [Eubacteriales bacterium]|nr:glycosyltransferase family A protein [Eubacteriales bacterium]
MDKISVVVPVHNGRRFLRKTIRGILNQDYKNLEVILVENFSEDNSLELCRDIQKEDDRVLVVTSEERGTSLARKKGVENASGKYILFSDQDDYYVSKSSIRKMHDAIVEDDVQVV